MMRAFIETRFVRAILLFIILGSIGEVYAATPWLHVEGNRIKDPDGNVVVLRGVDTIDIGAIEVYYGGLINLIDRLTDKSDAQGNSPGWYPRVIRLAIYPADEKAFTSPFTFRPGSDYYYNILLRPVVDYCALKDLYVIIDLHYIDNTYDQVATTSEFWEYMAQRFANDSHVIFELFNEPLNRKGSDIIRWLSVRKDMQTWVDIVRRYATKNLILVAGANFSQIIGPAATYPVSDPVGGNNIAYVSHIYPGHWGRGSFYKKHITTCAAVHPVFMSEWGFSGDSSNKLLRGTITDYGRTLIDFIEEHKMSSTAWIASYDWEPPMFFMDWSLRVGEGQMGGFVKDMLYLRRNDDQPYGLQQAP